MSDEPERMVRLTRSLEVGEHRGQPIVLHEFSDGTVRVEHLCDRTKGQRPDVLPTELTIAPALAGVGPTSPTPEGKVHRITWADDPPTITPSVQCLDCDLHGHVTAGRWSKA